MYEANYVENYVSAENFFGAGRTTAAVLSTHLQNDYFSTVFHHQIFFFEDKKIVSQNNMHRLNGDVISIHKFMLKPK